MDYANEGNIRSCLTKILENDWKIRLYLLFGIISGLNEIHHQDLIHCDIHDGNILIHENEMIQVYISDLGLSQSIKSLFKRDNDNIYGVMSFMAPEVLRGKPYIQASDIYSFSMIMWELTSGISPFNDRAHDQQLALSICNGERPVIINNAPRCYLDLMIKCWDDDPLKRPSASEILNIIKEWIFLPLDKDIENIGEELKSNIIEFMNTPIEHKLITEPHPQAYSTSRLFDFTGGKSYIIVSNSECLDCNIDGTYK
ncbi:hypothetical protein RclHR1_00480008 [Rhizophagus clarus]|nr:hypothetical protein RclHR1_00480008 [Rhizophagus clarus]